VQNRKPHFISMSHSSMYNMGGVKCQLFFIKFILNDAKALLLKACMWRVQTNLCKLVSMVPDTDIYSTERSNHSM